MRDLMKRILCDWNELNNLQEIKIIKKYADIGRFITLIATCKQHFVYLFRTLDFTLIQILIV